MQVIIRKIDLLVTHALKDQKALSHLDWEAVEMTIRSSMHKMGGLLLEKLVNSDAGGYRRRRFECSRGHTVELVE